MACPGRRLRCDTQPGCVPVVGMMAHSLSMPHIIPRSALNAAHVQWGASTLEIKAQVHGEGTGSILQIKLMHWMRRTRTEARGPP